MKNDKLNFKSTANLLYKILMIAGPCGFLSAVAVNVFFAPHQLLSGGLTGVAMIINYFSGIPLWLLVIGYNIPLFALSVWKLKFRFVFLSAVGIASYSFFLGLTQNWSLHIENSIISACFGAVLQGAGAAMALRLGGSLGGLDILAFMLSRKTSFSVGGIGIAFNVIILVVSACIFDVERALLTLLAMFVLSRVVDSVLAGFNRCKTVLVVSDKHEQFAPVLLQEMGRGITYLNGEGAYTGEPRRICYCVVRTMELAKLKDIIRKVDPDAFFTVIDTTEVMGGRGLDISRLF